MHRIEETPYGYRVVFEGYLERDETGALLRDFRTTIRPRGAPYSVLLDLRKTRAFPAEAQDVVKQAILHLKNTGMERNACVLTSAIASLQIQRLTREAGVASVSRTVDATDDPDWEQVALDWLVNAVEPEVSTPLPMAWGK